MLEKIGGRVKRKVEKQQQGGKTVEVVKEETEGGILHWGREDGPDMEWVREEIRKAFGGRTPRVLDPFAGGGAIPLEAMRLGCETTAIDINPVAWFILKCTLEYPQRLAGQVRPLPNFALESAEFMEGFFKGTGKPTKRQLQKRLEEVQGGLFPPPDVDLAWHVRAWGWWVLRKARADLERFYPTIDGKPTVAYLWARTVTCKNCRATVPLLKTRWLCRKDNKRIVLTMEPTADRTSVVFGVRCGVPASGGNVAQKKDHDKKLGGGTMSQSGVTCPCCGVIMSWDDLRIEGQAKRFGSTLLAVVVGGPDGKEYRLPLKSELPPAEEVERRKNDLFAELPFGLPLDNTPEPFGPRRHGAALRRYGMLRWTEMFTARQLLALGTFAKWTRHAEGAMCAEGYPREWVEATRAYLALAFDRLADYSSAVCSWHNTGEKLRNTFGRFAFPIIWDFAEVVPTSDTSGGYAGAIEWISLFLSHASEATKAAPLPTVLNRSSTRSLERKFDVILTDPPYYDAISYCDLMDFFHVWLRRITHALSVDIDESFRQPLGPKWDHQANDGELVDDPSRHGWDRPKSKAVYEDGMYRTFSACNAALEPDGRFVVIFAHKHPDAWETLVSAIIRAGFVVDASWPIQTEMGNRTRALSSAALASSVWLVCKKRPAARPGWDNRVLEEMRDNIHQRLNDYWRAGIRGPDFVWAATGPALEAYSKHPVVKKATEPGQVMTVSEFLRAVRRLVVDFVVGRVLTHNGDGAAVEGVDDLTTYYLLHRHDFGLDDAPAGACILYAVSCNLSDAALVDRHDLLARAGGKSAAGDDEEQDEDDATAEVGGGSGSQFRLKPWSQRKRKTLGYDVEGKPAALIDQAHRLMHLWKAGDVVKVDEYLNDRGLRRDALFHQLLQALIELAGAGTEERALLESISNHVVARGVDKPAQPTLFDSNLFE